MGVRLSRTGEPTIIGASPVYATVWKVSHPASSGTQATAAMLRSRDFRLNWRTGLLIACGFFALARISGRRRSWSTPCCR